MTAVVAVSDIQVMVSGCTAAKIGKDKELTLAWILVSILIGIPLGIVLSLVL